MGFGEVIEYNSENEVIKYIDDNNIDKKVLIGHFKNYLLFNTVKIFKHIIKLHGIEIFSYKDYDALIEASYYGCYGIVNELLSHNVIYQYKKNYL